MVQSVSHRGLRSLVRLFALGWFLLFTVPVAVANPPASDETRELAVLCRTWGMLKYYHPAVTGGLLDWDQVLVEAVRFHGGGTHLDLTRRAIAFMIEKAERTKSAAVPTGHPDVSQPLASSIQRVAKSKALDADQLKKLTEIASWGVSDEGYYVGATPAGNTLYVHEKTYAVALPSRELRILALARFWNIIEFFYPYKDGMGCVWGDVLEESLPRFIGASTPLQYHLEVMRLLTRLRDTHADAASEILTEFFGKYSLPVRMTRIGNAYVIAGFLHDSLATAAGFKCGDCITAIDGISMAKRCDQIAPFIGGSNEARRSYSLLRRAIRGQSASALVSIVRNGVKETIKAERYPLEVLYRENVAVNRTFPPWKILGGDVGYIDMERLRPDQIELALKDLGRSRAIVFDARCHAVGLLYPLLNELLPEPRGFARFSLPDLHHPGSFFSQNAPTAGPERRRDQREARPTIVLIDERTVSSGEFHVMALQAMSNVTLMGNQTAGTDGNVSSVVLPGSIVVTFSGLGVYYPSGKSTQRVGIKPDVQVVPSIKGISEGRDEVLEAALTFFRSNR
jgi:carboxyl-terminal processing protease